jgi:hypothetical protein
MGGNLKGRYHLGNIGVDGKRILKRMLQKISVTFLTGFTWFRIRISSVLL